MENIEAMLCAYVEGDLDAAGRAQIEKHLQEHPQHRKLMDDLIAMRDMVRSLPRVKAPMDVGESLRGQVERSILLDDSAGRAEPTEPGSRWPQLMAIAAVLLLFVSLLLVLYKALGPTLKPPVFTESAASPKAPELEPIDKDLQTAVMPPPTQSADAAAEDRMTATKAAQQGLLQADGARQQDVESIFQMQAANFSQVDFNAIRLRLQNSGYGVASTSNKTPSPFLMVVNSTNPPATNVQIADFLNNSKGISWKMVPGGSEPAPTTQPVTTTATADANSPAIENGAIAFAANVNAAPAAPTTQPASDVYVANGLTAQQADALRQSLSAKQQSGAQVQVSLQSALMLATTQPSGSAIVKPAESNDSALFGAPATTQPTVLEPALPTTAPSVAAGGPPGSGGGANASASLADNLQDQNNARALQPVDAVIVLQSAPAAPKAAEPVLTAPAPATQPAPQVVPAAPSPDNAGPATQPAPPSTQP
jgi:hypothetical protein